MTPVTAKRFARVWMPLLAATMGIALAVLVSTRRAGGSQPSYDPLAAARTARTPYNLEAGIPPQCYGETDGTSNTCWTCHTEPVGANPRSDWELQVDYAFSDLAKANHWTNQFVDRRAQVAAISDAEIARWIGQDNYGPLRRALARAPGYPGFVPDLDLDAGFDGDGFARDGSGWRAVRYQPFPGAFWPPGGSVGELYIRLPEPFRRDAAGLPSPPIYRLNLALLEAAIAADPHTDADRLDRQVEPVDERLIGFDLDGDGALGVTERIQRLPPTYAGGAAGVAVRRTLYPRGVELLHPVRYLDPDRPDLAARRMKELRYSRKVEDPDTWRLLRADERELDEKDEGRLPVYRGSPAVGLLNAAGWQLQGFIEDAAGRLRLQTTEEHRFCMGCHSALGVTVDQTFALARKVPGRDGWRRQDLRGLRDRPQVGHAEPEVATWHQRAGRPVPAGDDLLAQLAPPRARALALAKAYLIIVREQSFARGRDAVIEPADDLHRRIDDDSTGLGPAGRIYRDGHAHLLWE